MSTKQTRIRCSVLAADYIDEEAVDEDWPVLDGFDPV
jgi:hypothetical protein